MTVTNEASELLLRLLQRSRGIGDDTGDDAPVADDGGATLVSLAEQHRVAALLFDELMALPWLDDDARRRLVEARRLGRARNLRVAQTAQAIAPVLDDVTDGRWVIIKGPALRPLYDGRARTYVDLDVLVHRSEFAEVMTALEAAGQPALTANWQGFLEHGVGEVPLGDYHMVIDLHWHPIALETQRKHFAWDVEAMIARRQTFDALGGPLPTLDAVDTLLHLTSHTGLGGARRLIWFSDIDAAVRGASIDWTELIERARASGLATLSASVLDRVTRMLDTPVPRPVISELCRVPGWLGLNRRVARSRSDERAADGWSSGFLLTCGRDTIRSTGRSLASAAMAEVKVRAGRPAIAADGGDIDWHRVDETTDLESQKQAWLRYVGSDRT
ncbi:MAG: nucleotidyltransferase family protein [Actinomycetota bacterium]